jgi:hypothetical protein
MKIECELSDEAQCDFVINHSVLWKRIAHVFERLLNDQCHIVLKLSPIASVILIRITEMAIFFDPSSQSLFSLR